MNFERSDLGPPESHTVSHPGSHTESHTVSHTGGYTLVEMVAVITILSIVALVSSSVMVEGTRVYVRTAPALDAAYNLDHARGRMLRELRAMGGTDTISAFGATDLAFQDVAGASIAYALSGTDLLRNGDLLAQGVTALGFTYLDSTGAAAATAADIHLIETDMTVQVGPESLRTRFVAFPRVLSPVSGSGDDAGGGSASFPQPVAHWALEETSGSTVSDSVGSNDGTAYNGMSWGAGGAPGGGSAAQFDGTNDVVVVPHSSTFVLDEMTLQFWFRADGIGGYRDLVSKDSYGYDNGGQFSVYLSGDNVIATLESTSYIYVLDSGSRISSSTWHHVAFVVGSGGMWLYVDGVARDFDSYTGGLGTSSGGSGNTEPMAFGAWTGASGNGTVSPLYDHFDGRMDAIAFYGVALSADQVATLYAGGGVLP